MGEEQRKILIKEAIKNKVDKMDATGIIAEAYAQFVGCMDCTFQFTCDKRKPCYKTIQQFIKTGELL